VTPAGYLIDKSVLARLHLSAVSNTVAARIQAGLIGISIVTELEVGYSARSLNGYREMRADTIDPLLAVPLPARAESRAREVQAALVERGRHRAVGVADLLLAATAQIERLTVLHYDADFDLIAEITGQSTEWVVPRGSIP